MLAPRGSVRRLRTFVLGCGLSLAALVGAACQPRTPADGLTLFEADNPRFQYTGRVDFSNPKRPRFWAPGVYIRARFHGSACDLVLNDEVLWGKAQNYLGVVIDDSPPLRIQTTGIKNRIRVAEGLSEGPHTITICKATEARLGFLEFVGLRCKALSDPPVRPPRKLEFIGDSITCGSSSDTSEYPCGTGRWYDQQNAYLSYGPMTARLLDAEWHLSAVSGIGVLHSCCDMKETMPDVFASMDFKTPARKWDVQRYQPDAVIVCLGQNDGIQPSAVFFESYLQFVRRLRGLYPNAVILCLSSPMADASLKTFQRDVLARVVEHSHRAGDTNVFSFVFSRRYHSGCLDHPTTGEHGQMAQEVTGWLKQHFKW